MRRLPLVLCVTLGLSALSACGRVLEPPPLCPTVVAIALGQTGDTLGVAYADLPCKE